MQLTRHTDYALRVLMYLATNPGRLVTVAELAKFYDISRNHLVKVVQGLVKHGFLHTSKGKNGGMQLACNSDSISIGKVVRKMENHFNLVECFDSEQTTCALDGACRLKALLARATEDFLSNLDEVTLSDMSKPKLRQQIIQLQSLQR